jgi:hypothetical protein
MPIVCFAVLCAAAASLAACRPNRSDQPLPPPVVTTPTTAPSYAIPAVIDADYVARVMQALDHIYGSAIRHLAQTRSIDETFLRHLVATHNPRIFALVQDLWVRIQAKDFAGLAPTPADPRTRIDTLLRADRDCILLQGDRDLSPLHASDDPTNHQPFVALTPLRSDRNPERLNPTPWAINFSGQATDGSLPEDTCLAQ